MALRFYGPPGVSVVTAPFSSSSKSATFFRAEPTGRRAGLPQGRDRMSRAETRRQTAGVREAVEERGFPRQSRSGIGLQPLSGLPRGVAGLFPSSPSGRPLHFG